MASLLLLDRQAQRLLVLETNRKDVVNVTRLRALDGSNHEAFLKFWRQSRVKLIEGARYTGGWMTSYGAVAATLGHINAMRWQVYHRLPALRLEDDILMSHAADKRVQHAHRYRKLMLPHAVPEAAARGDPNGVRVVHFHWGGPIGAGADVYLTSLEGAALELRRICSSDLQRVRLHDELGLFDDARRGEDVTRSCLSARTRRVLAVGRRRRGRWVGAALARAGELRDAVAAGVCG